MIMAKLLIACEESQVVCKQKERETQKKEARHFPESRRQWRNNMGRYYLRRINKKGAKET